MTILTIEANGRLTLTREMIEHLGVQAGQRLDVKLLPGGHVELTLAPPADIRSARGILHRPGQKAMTIEDMQDAIEAGAAGELDED